jgi:hypothetical protein
MAKEIVTSAAFKAKLSKLDDERKKLIEAASDQWRQEHSDKVAELKELETSMLSNGVQFRSAFGGSSKGPRIGGGSRGPRGEGWDTIKAAIEANGGKAKAVDLKDAYAKLGRPTPLSVALASYVKGGKLKKKGKGREAEFSLA